jgi:hypothetical protein
LQDRLVFLIGAPRSGSTLLARMLGTHPQIAAPAELHWITPLAHLGYFARVERAPYDPIITEAAMRELVAALPGGESDYLDALRAASDRIYSKLLAPSGRSLLLDKTPAYALVLDFLAKLYPQARYVVLTRNPLAVWSSFVQSFFDGDAEAAHAHNPLLERYVPAIARFLRERPVPLVHLRYEDLVSEPESGLREICRFLGIEFQPAMIDYGARAENRVQSARGLGDPVTVARETRPTTASLTRWSNELAGDAARLRRAQRTLDSLLDPDLETWGFRRAELSAELARAAGLPKPAKRSDWSRHALERRVLVALRHNIQHNALGRIVRQVRRVCDVLLR